MNQHFKRPLFRTEKHFGRQIAPEFNKLDSFLFAYHIFYSHFFGHFFSSRVPPPLPSKSFPDQNFVLMYIFSHTNVNFRTSLRKWRKEGSLLKAMLAKTASFSRNRCLCFGGNTKFMQILCTLNLKTFFIKNLFADLFNTIFASFPVSFTENRLKEIKASTVSICQLCP